MIESTVDNVQAELIEESAPIHAESLQRSGLLLPSCRRCGRPFDIGGVTRSPDNRDFCIKCARKERTELVASKENNSGWMQLAMEACIPLWEQQPNESSDEYELWCSYRDLWPEVRPTITKVASASNVSVQVVQKAFNRWTWTARLQAWIREVNADRVAELRASRRQMVADHISLGEKMRAKMLVAVDNLDPEDVTPSELVALLKETQRLEQTSRESLDALEAETASDIDNMPEGLFASADSESRGNSRGLTNEGISEVVNILQAAGVLQVSGAKVGVRQTSTTEVVIEDEL